MRPARSHLRIWEAEELISSATSPIVNSFLSSRFIKCDCQDSNLTGGDATYP